jgi:hypothetical protein
MKRTASVFVATMVVLLVLGGANAADYKIDWYSVNSGGGLVAGGSYKLNSSIGQPAAGFVQSASFLQWVGFWAGEVPTPTAASTIAGAKSLPDGTFMCIAGKIATSAGTDFADFFYVEETGRPNGIRVAAPPGPIAGLARGSVVNVIGTLGSTAAGERQLTGPIVIIIGSRAPLTPLGMPNRAVGGGNLGNPPQGQYGVAGGSGLNNVGLLIRTWGRVVGGGPDYVLIDDGSGTPVRVDVSKLVAPPGMGQYVTVIGISSLYQATPGADRQRFVLPRADGDVKEP